MSLADDCRPQTFAEVIGQDAARDVLRNAVAGGKVGGRVFLLTGPSGTGKTTLARLFAKAVLCSNPHDGEPCNRCASCSKFLVPQEEASGYFVLKERGIEAIRWLGNHFAYRPFLAPRSVYLLEEAHSLTKEASDRALPLLERVPPFATVLLATTRENDLDGTLRRRCNWVRLRSIATVAIRARLREIAGARVEEATLQEIARLAHGNLGAAINDLQMMLEAPTPDDERRVLKTLGRSQSQRRGNAKRRGPHKRAVNAVDVRGPGRPGKEAERERAIMDVTHDGEWHKWPDILQRAQRLGVTDQKGMRQTRDRLEADGLIEVKKANPVLVRQHGE